MGFRWAGHPPLPAEPHGSCCRVCPGRDDRHIACGCSAALVDDVNAAECFAPEMLRHYESDKTVLSSYWDVEMALADFYGHMFSSLEDFQSPESRQCGLCGHINKTETWGTIQGCKHQICQASRKYWGLRDFRHPLPTSRPKSEAEKAVRGPWFRRQLMDKFGVGQIYRLPIGQRLDVVLALTLLRESVEAKREQEPTTGNPLAAIGKPEPRRQKAKADDCIACA